MKHWNDPRFFISLLLISLFAYAYFLHPSQLMDGAIIGAFSSAYGYWLGSSKSNAEARELTGKALDIAAAGGATAAANPAARDETPAP